MNFRKIITTLSLLTLLVGIIGCNAWHGAGKDVANTGDKMQGK